MSSFEIDNIIDHGISLHQDQMSSVDTNCLPSIKLSGRLDLLEKIA